MPLVKRRQAWGGRVSEWKDPLDAPMAEIAGSFGPRVARSDVAAVEALLARLGLPRPRLTVVVVGSNGKTSTASYLADMFTAAGCRTGLFTSPHIAYWTERVRVDGAAVQGDRFAEAAAAVSEVTPSDEPLRFFDVLTVAAASLFAEAGVEVAIYEAGIGGRSDATRALRPDLVVLTSVALEHTQVLGETEEEILRHKLDVAPRGATVFAADLPEHLTAVALSHAAAAGVELVAVPPNGSPPAGLPGYLARNWTLARSAAALGIERLGVEPVGEAHPRPVYGRFTAIARDGVDYLLDVAHNPQAWRAFLGELGDRLAGRPAVAAVAVTTERPLESFALAVAGSGLFTTAYATTTSVRQVHDPDDVAAALARAGQRARSAAVPRDAFEAAAADAGATDGIVAIFGSTFVVTDAMWWLREPPR